MDEFRFGVVDFPPWLYLKADNTTAGLLVPYYQQLFYFILDKMNVTYVRVNGSQKVYCSDNGICNEWLSNLQKGEVDFVRQITLDELENVGMNLSLVPIMKEDYCFLGNKQNVSVNFLKPGFFDFIHGFKTTFWFYLVILSIFVLTLNSVILKLQEKYLFIDTFWPQFVYLLGQNFSVNKSFQRKCFFLVFLVGQLLISKILSASLRTGQVQRSEYIRLDSLADVTRHNYTLFLSDASQCTFRLQKSEDKLARKLWNEAMRVNLKNKPLLEITKYIDTDGLVFLSTLRACKSMKTYSCVQNVIEQQNLFFRVSENPINQVKQGFLINKLIRKGQNKKIVKQLYSAFESGLISHKGLEDLFVKLQIPLKAPVSCMVKKDLEAKVHVVPISIHYFMNPLLIFITGIGLSVLVSIFILLLEWCKKHNQVRKIDLVPLSMASQRFSLY